MRLIPTICTEIKSALKKIIAGGAAADGSTGNINGKSKGKGKIPPGLINNKLFGIIASAKKNFEENPRW